MPPTAGQACRAGAAVPEDAREEDGMTFPVNRRHGPARVADRGRLARDLSKAVQGEVRLDRGSQAIYANDASIYRQVPIGVVIPRHAEDVLSALDVFRRHDMPVLARGCGTGLSGQNVTRRWCSTSRSTCGASSAWTPGTRTARVQPEVICYELRTAAAPHGLTWSVDPATHSRCTFGGMIGNNSCGTHSIMGGKTADNVIEMDFLAYDGTRLTVGPTSQADYQRVLGRGGRRAEIYRALHEIADRYAPLIRERYPDIPRRVSGYNLDQLLPETGFNLARALVGTESTCGLVLEATVRLLPDPPCHALLVVGYPDAATAADHVPELIGSEGLIGLEGFDGAVIDNIHKHGEHVAGIDELPEGGARLLAEYGGSSGRGR
jgi:FAD/FMN-containing dehydrogenase